MIDLTPSARQRFDDYFRRLRQALRHTPPPEAEDVEQSVREHIEVALAGGGGPVNAEQLSDVLDRLGAPDRWVPEQEQSVFRRVMERLRSGPEEWRLAYMAFGLFLLALVLIPIGIGVLLMFAAFVASRAYVDFLEGKGEPLGARRWLVYPPIALFLSIAIAFFVIGPTAPILDWGLGDGAFRRLAGEPAFASVEWVNERFVIGAAASVLGAWWIVASLIGMMFLPVCRFVFKPLLAPVRRVHFLGLTAIGTVALGAGVVLAEPWLSKLTW